MLHLYDIGAGLEIANQNKYNVEAFKPMAEQLFKGALYPKGAVVVTPTQIKNMAPGPDNNKEL